MMNNIVQQMLNNIINNSQLMKDPRARKTLEMLQHNDSQGLNNMLNNLCKEYGITPEEAERRAKQMFRTY